MRDSSTGKTHFKGSPCHPAPLPSRRARHPPVPVLVVPLPVDEEAAEVLAPFAGVHVGNEHILQAQVKALVLRGVGEEEERPEAQGDEGTKNKEQDKFFGESQGSPVVREGGGPQVQRGQPPPGERQQGGSGHPSASDPPAGHGSSPQPLRRAAPARLGGCGRLHHHHPPRECRRKGGRGGGRAAPTAPAPTGARAGARSPRYLRAPFLPSLPPSLAAGPAGPERATPVSGAPGAPRPRGCGTSDSGEPGARPGARRLSTRVPLSGPGGGASPWPRRGPAANDAGSGRRAGPAPDPLPAPTAPARRQRAAHARGAGAGRGGGGAGAAPAGSGSGAGLRKPRLCGGNAARASSCGTGAMGGHKDAEGPGASLLRGSCGSWACFV